MKAMKAMKAMEAMDATSLDSHQSDMVLHQVFTLTLFNLVAFIAFRLNASFKVECFLVCCSVS